MSDSHRRRPAKSGAIGAVLQEMDQGKHAAPSFTPTSSPMTSGHAPLPSSQRFFPLKGHARVPTEVCRPWEHADRGAWEFDHVPDLANSLRDIGQVQPALVRPISPSSGSPIRYEIIAGRARWEACKAAGEDLDVLIRPMDDKAAFKAMIDENEQRRSLSDYSRGLRFRKALEAKVYANQLELAEAVNMHKSQITKLLKLADLDPKIVAAFSSPDAVSAHLGYLLALAAEGGYRKNIIQDAGKIESGAIPISAIPEVWGGAPAERGASHESAAPAGSEQPVTASSKQRPTVRHFADDRGARLFSVRVTAQRAPVLKLAKDLPVSDELYEDLRRVLLKHAQKTGSKRKKS